MDILNVLRGGTTNKRTSASSRQQGATSEQHPLFVDHYSRPAGSGSNPNIVEGEASETTKVRRQPRVKVTGIEAVPAALEEFGAGGCLSPWVWKTMLALNYSSPTLVQRHAVPVIASGYDAIVTAQTGAGKTFAFLLPIFEILTAPGKAGLRALVIDPTRELAQQTVRETERFVGACSRKFQVRLLEGFNPQSSKRVDIGVTTPLRLVQLVSEGLLSLEALRVMVLDESDKLLDLGFQAQIDQVLGLYKAEISRRRKGSVNLSLQLAFVSATLPEPIVALAEAAMVAPVRVSVGHQQAASENVSQRLLFVGKEDGKLASFRQLVREGGIRPPTLVFVQSKERAQELCHELLFDGVMVDAIHAERTRPERDRVVTAFREGKVWVLICTDVMARGVDFKGVEMVVNYDLPVTAQTYIHRIGRTGRAGRKGEAITFFTEDDVKEMRGVVNVIRESGGSVPDWLVKALPGKSRKRKFEIGKQRNRIDTTSGYDRQKIQRKHQIAEMHKSKVQRSQ